MRRVMFIGGMDSSGAAGLSADLRAAAAFGVDAATVVTAVTVQSTSTCQSINPTDAEVVAAQLAAASEDVVPRVVKTGLLANAAQIRTVADQVRRWRRAGHAVDVIVDPVMNASSGLVFLPGDAVTALNEELLPLTDLLTPNLSESPSFPARGALGIRRLIKGGHATGAESADEFVADGQHWTLSAPRVPGAWRGTGCSIAAAIAANRAKGEAWLDAIVAARSWLQAAIRSGTAPNDGPGRLQSLDWRDVLADDVPDLWLGTQRASGFKPLTTAVGVYPIVDRSAWLPVLANQGVRTVQIRIKDLQGDALSNELSEVNALAQRLNLQLFINDYWREAIALGAFGVHLGQEDLDTADLHAIQAAGLRLGVSTHSYAEAARAKALKPSYIALGPIKPTTCKSMHFGPQGFDRLTEWHRLFDVPLVAIGGLTLSDLGRVRQSGCDGVAAVSAILKAPSPDTHAGEWVRAWGDRDAAVYG